MTPLRKGIRIWLDDLRPAPKNWIWVKTAQDTINLLNTNEVCEISLDHDLGDVGIDNITKVLNNADKYWKHHAAT
jgi:hypothetical protein